MSCSSKGILVTGGRRQMMVVSGGVGPRGPMGEGEPGPPGPPGSGIAVDVVRTASTALGGGRVLATNLSGALIYADAFNLVTLDGLLGLSLNAANAGDEITARVSGAVEDSGWTWIPRQPLFLGANGVMQQTAPVGAAFILRLGHAIDAHTIVFNPREPIVVA